MNPEFPQNERAKMEAKLTALLLGELHADEVAALSKAMEADPELAALYERLKVTIELVREMKPAVEEQAPLKLSAEKREKLLARFKTVAPEEFAKPRRVMDWLVPLAACIVVAGILAAMLLPSLARSKSKAQRAYAGYETASRVRNKAAAPTGENQSASIPVSGGADLAGVVPQETPPAPAAATDTREPQTHGGFALIGPASTPATPPTIVLPAGQGDAGAVPGQTVADNFNVNPVPLSYSASSDISEALKKISAQQTNVVARSMSWGVDAPKDEKSWTIDTHNKVGPITLPDGSVAQVSEEGLRQAMAEATNSAPSPVIEFYGGADSNAQPGLGEVAALGRMYRSDSSVARNEGFTTASTREEVGEFRFLMTNGVTSQAINSGALAWSTNSVVTSYDLGVAGANTYGGSGIVNADPLVVAKAANSAPTDGLFTAGLRTQARVGGVVQGETPKMEIALPQMTELADMNVKDESGKESTRGGVVVANQNSIFTTRANQALSGNSPGFGSGGGGGFGGGGRDRQPVLMPSSQQASGGKQVELAAAANARASSAADQSQLKTTTLKVDPSSLYVGLQNVGTIDFGNTSTNALAEALQNLSVASIAPADTNGGRGLRYVTGLDTETEMQLAVKGFLRSAGVKIDPAKGESVFYNDREGTLTVRSTEDDLELVKQAVDTLNVAPPKVTVKTKFPDVNSDDSARLGFDWYQQNYLKSNGAVTASAGSVPEGGVRTLLEGKVETSQMVQDGKLLYQLGKTEEAETKFQAALARDPNNQSALYYLSLAKQVRNRQTTDARNVTSMDRMAQVEKGWSDVGVRPRTNTSEKLNSIVFDKVSFADLSLDEVLRLLAQQTFRRDIDQEGVNFLLHRSATDKEFPKVTVSLAPGITNASLKDVLDAIVRGADRPISYKVLNQGVEFSFQDSTNSQLTARSSKVDAALPKPIVPPPTPQPEVLTRENAVSTFSLNVSDVSFKLAAATLEKGQMPEPGAIRSEEFINAFDYRDPEAAPGVPVAFASERARYPFAHNRELLRFSLKTAAAGRQAGRALNIVLLLDNSGSMERADRVGIIREALRVLAGQLHAGDTFSIVTFARTAQLRVDGIPGDQAGAAAGEIAKLTPEGGTNLGEALELAYETARHHYLANGDNRVVLLTDGAANLGDVNAEVLKQKVEAQRQQGIALDCFGIGWEGYNDDLLEVLTRHGDGRYGFINSPAEASTEFVAQIAGALHVAAADVKVQVEFNTNRVTSFRQIGYAKHQLTKEQFRDNTVDAAEIAAQEAGNALYTIEINPAGSGSIGMVRVRYKVPGTAEFREQAWDVPYTGGAVAMDQASPAMRLASTACAFSEWLATSPFAAEVSTDQLLRYMNGVPQFYGADGRPAKLEWMIRQAKSISGK